MATEKIELIKLDKYIVRQEKVNPCHKENNLSLKCLDENYYNRDKCISYFDNYNACRAFWNFVYKERRKKGIQPYLPEYEERPFIKEQYMPFFKR